jgi:hypothetical protein
VPAFVKLSMGSRALTVLESSRKLQLVSERGMDRFTVGFYLQFSSASGLDFCVSGAAVGTVFACESFKSVHE